MFLSGKQVRNVYVIDKTSSNFTFTKSTIDSDQYMVNVKTTALDGTVEDLPADRLYKSAIKRITMSIPKGASRYQFELKPDSTVLASYPYLNINLTIPNWYGVGPNYSYVKCITFKYDSNSTLSAEEQLYDAFVRSFKRESWNPFTISCSTSNNSVTLVEKAEYVNPDILIFNETLGFHGKVEEYFDQEAWKHDTINGKTLNVFSDDEPFTITKTEVTTYNAREMYELEHAGLKTRADIYGLGGWPNVNPSSMSGIISLNDNKDYYTLDINYISKDKGIANPKQEKTMTFICEDFDVLNTIVTAMGYTGATEPTTKDRYSIVL